MGHARHHVRRLTLFLTADGGAELLAGDDQLWASDSDEEFLEEFGTEILDENDVDAILEYLIETERLTEEEADRAEVRAEVLQPNLAAEEELEEDEAALEDDLREVDEDELEEE